MDKRFEHAYTHNEKHPSCYLKYMFFQCTKVLAVFAFWFFIWLVLAALNFYLGLIVEGVVLVLLIPAFLIFQYTRYRAALKYEINRDKEFYGGEYSVSTVFYNDDLHRTSSVGFDAKFEYTQLKKIVEKKDYFLLETKAYMVYMLPKDGFVTGNAEEFKNFLREKGVKIIK